jgi:hypothetical protein
MSTAIRNGVDEDGGGTVLVMILVQSLQKVLFHKAYNNEIIVQVDL